jgi:hypothetical protein
MPSWRATASAVARQHDDAQPVALQGGDRVARAFLDRIGDRDQPRRPAVERHRHDGFAPVASGFRLRRQVAGRDAERLEQSGGADGDAMAVDRAGDPLAGQTPEIAHGRQRNAALGRGAEDRGSQRMFAALFERRG